MKEPNLEIRAEKRKVLIKFLIIILSVGVASGSLSVILHINNKELESAFKLCKDWYQEYGWHLSTSFSAALVVSSIYTVFRGNSMCLNLEEEDEFGYEKLERKLNTYNACLTACMIAGITFFLTTFTGSRIGIDELGVKESILCFVLFSTSIFICAFAQRKLVELKKQINPDKKGDALSFHFQKEWLESCDELEKMRLYQAAYKVYAVTPILYLILIVVLHMVSFYFEVGILPFFIIGILWITQTVIQVREMNRLTGSIK